MKPFIVECGRHLGLEPFLEILDADEKYISIETVRGYEHHSSRRLINYTKTKTSFYICQYVV